MADLLNPPIDYAQVSRSDFTLQSDALDYLLWSHVAPNFAAVSLLVWSAWYAWQARAAKDAAARTAYANVANQMLLSAALTWVAVIVLSKRLKARAAKARSVGGSFTNANAQPAAKT